MNFQDQLYTIFLPIVVMVIFAAIGFVRGTVREAIVAAVITLAGFINLQWGDQWGQGLADLPFGWNAAASQFGISFAVLWLLVLIVGYGLGTYVPREPQTGASRLGGALLGLISGAAIAGWSLRYAYTYLDNAQTSSIYYTTTLSQALMIWAAWFPLILAFLGAILVLVGPMRRAQYAVSQPARATDWTPSAPPSVPAPAPLGATAGVSAPQMSGTSVATTAPVMRVDAWRPPESHSLTPSVPQAPSQQAPSPSSNATGYMPEADAPPTSLLPASERPTQSNSADSSWLTSGLPSSVGSGGNQTRAFYTAGPPNTTPAEPDRWAGTDEARQPETQPVDNASSFAQSGVPSWLMQDAATESSSTPTASSGNEDKPAEPSAVAETSGGGAESVRNIESDTDMRCANCGAALLPNASFCTECGTRVYK